jgi:hypothetical protein
MSDERTTNGSERDVVRAANNDDVVILRVSWPLNDTWTDEAASAIRQQIVPRVRRVLVRLLGYGVNIEVQEP